MHLADMKFEVGPSLYLELVVTSGSVTPSAPLQSFVLKADSPIILMQHRLLPVQLHHYRGGVPSVQRILDLLPDLLHTAATIFFVMTCVQAWLEHASLDTSCSVLNAMIGIAGMKQGLCDAGSGAGYADTDKEARSMCALRKGVAPG